MMIALKRLASGAADFEARFAALLAFEAPRIPPSMPRSPAYSMT